MKVAYFDCAYGASGDMLLGALVAAGLSTGDWLHEIRKIALPSDSFEIEIKDVMRCSLAAKKVNIFVKTAQGMAYEGPADEQILAHSNNHGHEHEHEDEHEHENEQEHGHEHGHLHRHAHAHTHSHDAGHEHPHLHEHSHEQLHDHEHNRNLPEILDIIEKSKINPGAKKMASDIFKTLGYAEAKVHGTTIDKVHFHEVGAVDAIIDIVGFAIGYHLLGIERCTISLLPVGSGRVKTAHGLYPVPAPATVNIMIDKGISVMESPFKHECLTPTGAAILCTIANKCGVMPSMKINNSGYGAGSFDPNDFPNVCRMIIGDAS